MTAPAIPFVTEDTEVTEKASRRTSTAEYKRKIVKGAGPAGAPGKLARCFGARGCTRPT